MCLRLLTPGLCPPHKDFVYNRVNKCGFSEPPYRDHAEGVSHEQILFPWEFKFMFCPFCTVTN